MVAVCGHGIRYLVDAGARTLGDDARRYVAVGRFAARSTPENAIFIALQHSGSLRQYSGRLTIRFDLISVGLDRALSDLERAGWRPFIVLEDWEETQFKQQFAARSVVGRLDRRPMARQIDYGVNIYDPVERRDVRTGPAEIPRVDCA